MPTTGEYYSFRDAYIAFAVGPADLTAFRNADAALVVGELQAIDDPFVSGSITMDRFDEEEHDAWGSGNFHAKTTVKKAAKPGQFRFEFRCKTAMALYWAMGACTTTEATPNTHAITPSTSQTPPFLAFHVEFESSTYPIRYDLLGCYVTSLELQCEDNGIATYTIEGEFLKSVAGADLAKPTAYTDRVYQFADAMTGGITFTYNSNALNVLQRGFTFRVKNDHYVGGIDSGGYPSVVVLKKKEFEVDLTVSALGTNGVAQNLYVTSKLALGDYAGDLLVTIKLQRSATDYIQVSLNKTRLLPFEWSVSTDDQFSSDITLVHADGATVAIEAKDTYNNDYYENPA
jgi:hypothetical protein